MYESIGNCFSNALRSFLLWGYGWQTRRLRDGGLPRNEWRDPVSGQWYSASQAMKILENQLLAGYDRKDRSRRQYSLRC
jgi:hypothetical protein